MCETVCACFSFEVSDSLSCLKLPLSYTNDLLSGFSGNEDELVIWWQSILQFLHTEGVHSLPGPLRHVERGPVLEPL